MKITLRFAWYDLWVGFFIDREKRRIYLCPLPCLLFTIYLPNAMQTELTLPITDVPAQQWAILEIMGHERLAGRISEVLLAGAKMLQVDVPASNELPGFTRLLSPTALFSLTPVPEQVATIVAGNLQKTAVSSLYTYSMSQQVQMSQALGLPAPKPQTARSWDDEDADDNDDDSF